MPKEISQRSKRVWQRMIEWYGTRVREHYGDAPPADWCKAVDAADDTTVQRGLSLIKSRYLDHPPTLPQFEACMRRPENSRAASTVQEQLCAFAMRTYGAQLTPKQIRDSWTYYPGQTGDLAGVKIPADGDALELRVTVQEMQSGQVVLV